MSKKNTAIFLAAIASATALATPIDALPKGQVEAADAANWKGTRAYTEDELKLMNSILSGVRNIVGSLKRNVDDQVMFRADKEARLQELLEAMAAFRAVENVLKFPTELNQQATKEARARINALIRASKIIARASASGDETPIKLVETLLVFKLAQRRYEWQTAMEVIENFKMIDKFTKIDESYSNFKKTCDNILRHPTDWARFSPHWLLTSSGLNDFVFQNGGLRPELDAELIVLDKYLDLISANKQKALADQVREIKERSSKALWWLNKEHDAYGELALSMLPEDRKLLEEFFKSWVSFLDEVDKCVKDFEESFAMADDKSSVVGKIRYCTGFSPNKAFDGGSVGNCCPKYRNRVRRIINECKGMYKDKRNAIIEAGNSDPQHAKWRRINSGKTSDPPPWP